MHQYYLQGKWNKREEIQRYFKKFLIIYTSYFLYYNFIVEEREKMVKRR